jgi:hypothetical protein
MKAGYDVRAVLRDSYRSSAAMRDDLKALTARIVDLHYHIYGFASRQAAVSARAHSPDVSAVPANAAVDPLNALWAAERRQAANHWWVEC